MRFLIFSTISFILLILINEINGIIVTRRLRSSPEIGSHRQNDCNTLCTTNRSYLSGFYDHFCEGCRCKYVFEHDGRKNTLHCYPLYKGILTRSRSCTLECIKRDAYSIKYIGAYYLDAEKEDHCVCIDIDDFSGIQEIMTWCETDTFISMENKCIEFCGTEPRIAVATADYLGKVCECVKIDEHDDVQIIDYVEHQLQGKYKSLNESKLAINEKVQEPSTIYRTIHKHHNHPNTDEKMRDCKSFCESSSDLFPVSDTYYTTSQYFVDEQGCQCNNKQMACVSLETLVFTDSRLCTIQCKKCTKKGLIIGAFFIDNRTSKKHCACFNKKITKNLKDEDRMDSVSIEGKTSKNKASKAQYDMEHLENGCVEYCDEKKKNMIAYVNIDLIGMTATCECYDYNDTQHENGSVIEYNITYPPMDPPSS